MLETTATYWGENYFSESYNRREWQGHPLALERLHVLQDKMYREEWFFKKYLQEKPVQRALGIGVGRAETEIGLIKIGAVEHFDLYDVSPVGLDYAKSCAEKLGFGHKVTCHCTPIDDTTLPDDTYDLVTFVASLHHMNPLEPVLRNVVKSMKMNGLFWGANEYIGPDRFEYPAKHADIARAFYRTLPKELRNPNSTELILPTGAEVAAADPSEAPCSSQIEPAMRYLFPDLEVKPLYGSFAFILFWGLNHDALYDTLEGPELVHFILGMDTALVDSGVLPTYFAHLMARKTSVTQERALASNVISVPSPDSNAAAKVGGFFSSILPRPKSKS